MIKLLKIELLKVAYYRTFWVFVLLYAMLILLLTNSVKGLLAVADAGINPFSFPQVWHNLAYLVSYLHALPCILIIMLISNEFSFKTFRQNVIDGMSRGEAVSAKFVLIGFFSIASMSMIAVYGLIRGLADGEFDHAGQIFEQVYYMPRLLLQLAGYMALAALFGFVFKKAALAIVGFLTYLLLAEGFIGMRLPETAARYLPLKVLSQLVPFPVNAVVPFSADTTLHLGTETAALLAVVYIVLFYGGSLLLMRRANL
ncbi:MAG: ABC transporter permease [Chitinophagales bacterium]|nr:MAG: ABC transporter permease [Chitinophagales bacterium]